MNFEELIKINDGYNSQINALRKEQNSFQLLHGEEFNKSFTEKQSNDRQWFVKHFDYILKHKDRLKCNKPFSEIVIDFLPIYKSGGLRGGVAWNIPNYVIKLKDLCEAWENGFTYNGCPIISFQYYEHNNEEQIIIIYIKDNDEVTVTGSYSRYDGNKSLNEEIIRVLTTFIELVKDKCISEKDINYWDNYPRIDILKKGV